MVITKILEGTLSAGQTTVTFTDSDIPNSFIKIGCTNPDLFPAEQSISGNVLTIKYEAQSSSLGVVVELAKAGLDIIDDLTSDDAASALSAKQGKALKSLIDNIHVTAALSELTDVDIADLANDDILLYDETEGKWHNSSLPSIPADIADLDDVVISSPSAGQVLTYDNGDWINSNPPTAGISYTTSEQNTGIKWTDGKDIYQKSYEYTSISGGDNIFSFDLPSDALVIDQNNTFISTSEKMYWTDNNISGNSINLVNTNYQRTVINIASVLAPYLSKATITVKYTKGN